jgi:hypothetical protein
LEAVFSVVRSATVAAQLRGKHASKTIEELCYLRGPCRRVISGTSLELSSFVQATSRSRNKIMRMNMFAV